MSKIIKIDKIVRSKRRTISIEISNKAELIVRAPYFLNKNDINNFVEEKRNWIQKKISEVSNKQFQKKRFSIGEKFLFLGKEYPMEIHKTEKYAIFFQIDKFVIAEDCIENARDYFIIWYKNQALIIFQERINQYASKLRLNYSSLKLSSASKRWGSCSSRKSINLNWRLIMAPLEVIDYVIIHELAHTKEMNHSSKFWKIVEKEMPDYNKHRKWLKDNGYKLEV